MSIRRRRLAPYLLALALPTMGIGCEATPEGIDSPVGPTPTDLGTPSPEVELLVGDEVVCHAPVAGMDRFTEESQARGLTRPLSDPGAMDWMLAYGHGGSTVAQDLDGDGDIDLMFGRFDGGPDVYMNDGTGHFSLNPVEFELPPRRFETTSVSAVDLTGDATAEIMLSNDRWALLYEITGERDAHRYEEVHLEETTPRRGWLTHNWGDPDGDNDLDLLLPTMTTRDLEGNGDGCGSPGATVHSGHVAAAS